MKVLKVIGILLLVVVALALIASLVLPKKMEVAVDETIEAPIEVVWNNINSFQKSDKWSPWYDVDENMKVTFDGEEGTVGSSFSWSGNKDVQSGTQTFTAIDAEKHSIETSVKHGWGEGVGKAWLEDLGEGKTKISWTYEEEQGIPGNLFAAMFGAKDMMTKMEKKALSNLKALAEEEANNTPEEVSYDIEEITREAVRYAGKKEIVKWADMKTYFDTNMPMIGQAVGASATGAPTALYWDWDTTNQQAELTVAMPIGDSDAPEGYEVYEQPAGQYLMIKYYGPYEGSEAAHMAMGAYMEEKGLQIAGAVMEEYITDPSTEPDTSKWLTHIVYPVIAATEGETEE